MHDINKKINIEQSLFNSYCFLKNNVFEMKSHNITRTLIKKVMVTQSCLYEKASFSKT